MSDNKNVGQLVNGQLAPCPKKANCVSTDNKNINRRMPSVTFAPLDSSTAMELLIDVVEAMPKTELVKKEPLYLYAVAKTMVFEFFHDVEFLLDESEGEIKFRSASRLGMTDFGTNKRRMQSISARFIRKKQEWLEQQEA